MRPGIFPGSLHLFADVAALGAGVTDGFDFGLLGGSQTLEGLLLLFREAELFDKL